MKKFYLINGGLKKIYIPKEIVIGDMPDYSILLNKIFPPNGEVKEGEYSTMEAIMIAIKFHQNYFFWEDAGLKLINLGNEQGDSEKIKWGNHLISISFRIQNKNRKKMKIDDRKLADIMISRNSGAKKLDRIKKGELQ